MDKTIRRVTNPAEQQAETYSYWRSRSASERFEATSQLSQDLYRDYHRRKASPMMKDQRDLLLALNAQSVKYLIVGGHAYSHYTEPRATKDLDVFIDTSHENAERIFRALAQFGAPMEDVTVEDMQDIAHGHQLGVDPDRVDILKSIDGIDFASAWESGETGIIDNDIPVRYISVSDLIKNKLAVGRLRDLADVEDLRSSEAANSKPKDEEDTENG